ncbi:MAG: hypothetical protein M5U12_14675 [Verrucomicrobia bacterium]|nr:hypothetical protein [Verrucomicrobiota bacterium]
MLVVSGWVALALAQDRLPAAPNVEVEEDVYTYVDAQNGAGPMWCYGSTCLVRLGEQVFASGLETVPGARPLNNCRWVLFERKEDGWRRMRAELFSLTREPSPVAGFGAGDSGRVFLSAHPTLQPDQEAGGPGPKSSNSRLRTWRGHGGCTRLTGAGPN